MGGLSTFSVIILRQILPFLASLGACVESSLHTTEYGQGEGLWEKQGSYKSSGHSHSCIVFPG